MLLFIHRPFEVWPALGAFRIELIYVLLTSLVWAATPGKRWIGNPLDKALFAFAGAVLLAGLLSPWSDASLEAVIRYLKLFAFFIMLITAVHDADSLRKLTQAFL